MKFKIINHVMICLIFCLLTLVCSSAAPMSSAPRSQGALPEAVVLIDVGHGGVDSGTNHGKVLEKDINLAVAKRLYLLLNSHGIDTVMNRDSDYALSDDNRWHATRSRHNRDLSQRAQLSKELRTGLLISLHVNWANDVGKRGPLVLHQNNGQSVMLAAFIQNTLNKQQGSHNLPRAGKPYYLLRKTKVPAVIVEMGFMSHSGDRAMLTDTNGQRQVAEAIAAGLRQYLLLIGE